ncbi:2-hydroxychromene-2-carboxylate isomerase [Kiloniella sp. EL199]|uniref:2-hydroxychromene-2-carboxylate isomerase n=1 Tax=Kiloniella sp. EL199 TaxID=2107581 RepID=UPI000EA3388F|nr:2-hydroxychromene-2-carboxylate isomerase [Kiloniella sp. EL199]
MNRELDFYFDFSSPYAYFAAMDVDKLAERYDLALHWHPILLGAIFKKTGAQPLLSMPLKQDYAQHDLERTARLKKLPFIIPPKMPFMSLAACRAFYWLKQKDKALAHTFAKNIFKAGYQMGLDISDKGIVTDLVVTLGFKTDEILTGLKDQNIKDQLRSSVDTAQDLGVFGSPYFIFNNEPFWGYDRMSLLEEWITKEGW